MFSPLSHVEEFYAIPSVKFLMIWWCKRIVSVIENASTRLEIRRMERIVTDYYYRRVTHRSFVGQESLLESISVPIECGITSRMYQHM
jgi:hypothetical protein